MVFGVIDLNITNEISNQQQIKWYHKTEGNAQNNDQYIEC